MAELVVLDVILRVTCTLTTFGVEIASPNNPIKTIRAVLRKQDENEAY
jgi:hypothetical protein